VQTQRWSGPALVILLLLTAQSMSGGVLNSTPIQLGTSLDSFCAGAMVEETGIWNASNPFAPSSSEKCAPRHPGGLVLTLDDKAHLASWWEFRQEFIERGIRLTMFIDRTETLNEVAWEWLQAFQEDGHEIAVHGAEHESLIEHIEAGGSAASFVEQRVLPEIIRFQEHGINVTSYAYPNGHRTPESDALLLEHFRIIRATGRWYGNDDISRISPNSDAGLVVGLSTDREYNQIGKLLNRLEMNAGTGGVLITYGHRLDGEDNPYHTTNPSVLFALAEKAQQLGIPLMTISELAQPGQKEGVEHMYQFLRHGSIETANSMLDNCWNLPRFDEICFVGNTPTWREDPYDENYWRFVFYSLRPMRHLLYAWESTGDIVYRDRLVELLYDFNEDHKTSPWVYYHEADKHGAAFRGLVLVEIRWTLAHDSVLSIEEAKMIDDLIHETGIYLADEANFQGGYNHGFTQAAALLTISTNHPKMANTYEFNRLARLRIDGLMSQTIGSDGVLIENSPYYHFYIMEKVGEIAGWADRNGVDLPNSIKSKLPLMVAYATRIAHPDGSLPLLAASIPSNGMESGGMAAFIGDSEFAWARSQGEFGSPPTTLDAWFDSTGQFIWRSSWIDDKNQTAHLVFDVGPYRTAHSELDASNLVWWAGRPILIDPGLYSYESSEARDFFRGSLAHNILTIDGLDQREGAPEIFHRPNASVSISNPLSSSPLATTNSACAYTSHSLSLGTIERWVCAIGNHSILIIDRVESDSPKNFDIWWHLDDGLLASVNNSGWDIYDENELICKAVTLNSGSASWEVIRGRDKPLQGWVANNYESMVPATVLHSQERGVMWASATLFSIGNVTPHLYGNITHSNTILKIETDEGSGQVTIPAFGSINGFKLESI
jgi:peptidoglycan/xylan/chitin deacetylase (PgdA/CDA1 family)